MLLFVNLLAIDRSNITTLKVMLNKYSVFYNVRVCLISVVFGFLLLPISSSIIALLSEAVLLFSSTTTVIEALLDEISDSSSMCSCSQAEYSLHLSSLLAIQVKCSS